jgi:hypothetical protein
MSESDPEHLRAVTGVRWSAVAHPEPPVRVIHLEHRFAT